MYRMTMFIRLSLLFLTTILSQSLLAQVNFEKGYFIESNGQETECLIKNKGQRNVPAVLEYKVSEAGPTKTIPVESLNEFGIDNFSRFQRSSVDIDQSNSHFSKLSDQYAPDFMNQSVMLRVLLIGKASLYKYYDGSEDKYFFKADTGKIEPLIYKKYRTIDDQIAHNESYKSQLLKNLDCGSVKSAILNGISYSEKDLTALFVSYNRCMDSDYSLIEQNAGRRSHYWLNVRPGISMSDLTIQNYPGIKEMNLGMHTGLRFGVEGEFILPFNKNKWSIILEPTFRSYQGENIYRDRPVTVDFKSIEFPLGLRHYIFLNEKSSIFLNGSFVIDILLGEPLIIVESHTDLELENRMYFTVGAGYKFLGRYSMEFRYGIPSGIINYTGVSARYKSLSLIVGYRIFGA